MQAIIRICLSALTMIMLFPSNAICQNWDEVYRNAKNDFSARKAKAESDYAAFRAKANANYAEGLRRVWNSFKTVDAVPVPLDDDIPPVIKDEDKSAPVPPPVVIEVPAPAPVPEPAPAPVPEPLPIVPPVPQEQYLPVNLTFCGAPCSINFPQSGLPKLNGASEKNVSDFWASMSDAKYDRILSDCLEVKKKLDLPDWTFVIFVRALSERICNPGNKAVALQLYILSQCGYDVVHARDDAGKLYMLMNTDALIYDHESWCVDGDWMYMVDKTKAGSLYISQTRFPNTRPLHMQIDKCMKLPYDASPARQLKSRRYPEMNVTVSVNTNLINLMNDYPTFAKRGNQYSRWAYYAAKPLDSNLKSSLYPELRKFLAGKSEEMCVAMILNFVQTAFVYGYDDQIWGDDRAFFAEETLFYPYSDCEDRAILFSKIVHDLTGLDVALVYYPGHLAAAVRFRTEVSGDAFIASGKKYVVCDPTYVNASIGETMPGMDNGSAVIIEMNKYNLQ